MNNAMGKIWTPEANCLVEINRVTFVIRTMAREDHCLSDDRVVDQRENTHCSPFSHYHRVKKRFDVRLTSISSAQQ